MAAAECIQKVTSELLLQHFGHRIVVSVYGPYGSLSNVALECEDCQCVILDIEPCKEELEELGKLATKRLDEMGEKLAEDLKKDEERRNRIKGRERYVRKKD